MSSECPPAAGAFQGQSASPAQSESPESQPTAAVHRRARLFDRAICLGLILLTFAVYAQVADFAFVDYDDGLYVFQNEHVQAGLTFASIKWAFTGVVSNNWMPITLLSHILDGQLFQMESGIHHLVNVLFASLADMLLYMTLKRATGARWRSAFVALVFAMHPLHVESVAWVSERKDTLCAIFWFLALYAYVRYTERPSPGRYLLVAAPFCLGLMSKPMLVTFPFTLLLFDIWPLRRTQWPRTILEKLPLISLSAAESAVTYFTQQSTGALYSVPLALRMANVFISYVTYIRQTLWPTRLAFFYPYHSIPPRQVVFSLTIVLGVSALAIWAWRRQPYFTVGWFWFIGTLIPVVGVVQAGRQAHADRYMYVPMIGLLLILAWGAADVVQQWPRTKLIIAASAVVCCAACMVLTWKETAYWRNSETLYQRAIDVTLDNWVAEYNLGTHYTTAGRSVDAIPHFEAVLRINPNFIEVHNNLGAALLDLEGCEAAIPHFEAAARAQSSNAVASYNLGGCQMTGGNYEAAIPYFEAAIRARPDYAEAHYSLAVCLSKIPGRAPEAVKQYEMLLRLTPDDPRVYSNLSDLAHK
jgi:tetratricopeptide (TPR) repeat protein